MLFSFAFDPDNPDIKIDLLASGLLWMVYSFAAALALNRTFSQELQNDCLDALIAAPIPPSALYLGKTLGNFALLLAIDVISLGAFSLFYQREDRDAYLATAAGDCAGHVANGGDGHVLQRFDGESAAGAGS